MFPFVGVGRIPGAETASWFSEMELDKDEEGEENDEA
jgi:hypothetical protein